MTQEATDTEEYYQQVYRCSGCAFTSGTEANKSDKTQIVIRLCLEIVQPFYCHWRVHELQSAGMKEAEAMETAKAEGNLPLCRGYVDALAMLIDKRYYENQPEWKKALAMRAMQLLEDDEDDEDGKLSAEEVDSFGAAVREIAAQL